MTRQFKTELADLSFKYLCPAEHEEIDSFINSKLKSYENLLADATSELAERLSQDAWFQERIQQVAVTGRTKSRHSTWKKLLRDGCATEQVNDLVALRVVIHPSSEHEDEHAHDDLCYHALGKIHGLWTPLPRTLKDYISSPKPNGYRSLHTTVLVGTQPLEIQIRTVAMHHVAEFGAAAHWAYKAGGGARASLPWLQLTVRKWDHLDCAHEFMQLVRQELLGTRVFVFTANGQILNLARCATLAAARWPPRPLATRSPARARGTLAVRLRARAWLGGVSQGCDGGGRGGAGGRGARDARAADQLGARLCEERELSALCSVPRRAEVRRRGRDVRRPRGAEAAECVARPVHRVRREAR
eukprot:5809992-Prymnesium_polylepis.2